MKIPYNTLVKPVVVKVLCDGAEWMELLQTVELFRIDIWMGRLSGILQKTAPPTLIFCKNKSRPDQELESCSPPL